MPFAAMLGRKSCRCKRTERAAGDRFEILHGRSSAVHDRHQGLLFWLTALIGRCAQRIMAFAMVVDAKDDAAVAFYRHHGFVPFASVAMSLYLPLAEVRQHFEIN